MYKKKKYSKNNNGDYFLSISWIKSVNDNKNFKIFESIGCDVYKVEDLEKTDDKIKELILKNYSTIVLSNEVASFSQDIITKYSKSDKIKIIISYK